jgi:hypothetical protein
MKQNSRIATIALLISGVSAMVATSCVTATASDTAAPDTPTEQTDEVQAAVYSCGGCAKYLETVLCGSTFLGDSTFVITNDGDIDAIATFDGRTINVPAHGRYKRVHWYWGADLLMTNNTPETTLCMSH